MTLAETALGAAFDAVSRALVKAWNWISLDIRVARSVDKEMKAQGVQVSRRQLRRVLGTAKVLDKLRAGDEKSADEAREHLAPLDATSERSLFAAVARAYESKLPNGDALFLQNRQFELARQRDTQMLTERIVSRDADAILFESRLASFHPHAADEARRLRQSWPQIERAVAALAERATRAEVLAAWADRLPDWTQAAPVDGKAWVADRLADAGHMRAFRELIGNAMTEGLSSRPYWTTRLFSAAIEEAPDAKAFFAHVPEYPLAKAIIAAHAGDPARARQLLDEWHPSSERERRYRDVHRATWALAVLDLDEAIRISLELYRNDHSTHAGLIAVRGLLMRESRGASPAHQGDAESALQLALSVRDLRRQWGLGSAGAATLAIKATRLLSNPREGWRILEESTPEEAASTELRNLDALMNADEGDLDRAKQLTAKLSRSASKLRALASIAEREDDSERAVANWIEAIELTDEWNEKAEISFRLALHGTLTSFVDQLAEDNDTIAEELRLIAGLFAGSPGALSAAESRARESRQVAQALVHYYMRAEPERAVRVARTAAQRWNEPHFWAITAKLETDLGHPEALASTRSALLAGGSSWGGRDDMYRLQVQIASASGNWSGAVEAAAALVRNDATEVRRVWLLAYCQFHNGDHRDAFLTWSEIGGRPAPDTRENALLWLQFVRLFGAEACTEEELLAVVDRWRSDEEVRRYAAGAVLIGELSRTPAAELESADAEPEAVADAIVPESRAGLGHVVADYLTDFPENSFLFPVAVDMKNPVQSLIDAIGERPDTRTFDADVAAGKLPLGLATIAHNKSYAELTLLGVGARYSGRLDDTLEAVALNDARSLAVVADTTAVFAMSLLASVGLEVAPECSEIVVTIQQVRDAVDTANSVDRASRLTIAPGSTVETTQIVEVSEGEHARRIGESAALVARMKTFRRIGRPRIEVVAPLPENAERKALAWLSAVDLAAGTEPKAALWADDVALRQAAHSLGVPAFGTVALVEHLGASGTLSPEQVRLAQTVLISRGYTGIPFSEDLYWDAYKIQSQEGLNVLNAMAHGDGDSAMARFSFVLRALADRVDDPEAIRDWVAVFCRWLTGRAKDGGDASRNLQVWALELLRQPWMSSSTLAFVATGFRQAAADSADWFDPVLNAIAKLHGLASAAETAEVASQYLLELITELREPERLQVLAIVFRR